MNFLRNQSIYLSGSATSNATLCRIVCILSTLTATVANLTLRAVYQLLLGLETQLRYCHLLVVEALHTRLG